MFQDSNGQHQLRHRKFPVLNHFCGYPKVSGKTPASHWESIVRRAQLPHIRPITLRAHSSRRINQKRKRNDMKNKLTMLTLVGALALSGVAPCAMASNTKGSARSPKSATSAKAQATKKAASRAWVPNHVLFPGLADKK
jgi:hypothetical protein